MKSRITIDVDVDNQPVIKIDYTYSDDVRDTLVKKFIESFGHESQEARVIWEIVPNEIDQRLIVRPVSPEEQKQRKNK